jgi:hypothetical protein
MERPGERREPVHIALEAPIAELFTAECKTTGVAPERAYALLLERRLLLDDLREADIATVSATPALDRAASVTRADVALDGPTARYLRSFVRRESPVTRVTEFLCPVPVRMYARAVRLDPREVVEVGSVAQATAWERASVAGGRTMAEWALLVLLTANADSQC